MSWRIEARVGGEGVYGDGGALMRGMEVVVVAARVVGDDDVGRRYVVVECGIAELHGDACRCVPRFGRGVVGHEDVDGPGIRGQGGRGPVGVGEWGVPGSVRKVGCGVPPLL